MRRILSLVLMFVIVLGLNGCDSSSNTHEIVELQGNIAELELQLEELQTEMDAKDILLDSVISNIANLNDNEITSGLGIDSSDLDSGSFSGSSADRFEDFNELLNFEYADFYYGEVMRVEENTVFVDSVYFNVLKSNNDTDDLIRITIEKDSKALRVGDLLVLHMSYIEGNDYYSLSTLEKSIFVVDGESVSSCLIFKDEFYDRINNEKEVFFNLIFD